MFAHLNGAYLPRSEAKIPVEDRGFIFGDGVYEVWRVINGRLFESERHLARLAFGLSELKIAAPDVIEPAKLAEIAERLLAESNLTEGEATLYLEITRGVAPRTHQFPPANTQPTVYITVNRLTAPDALRATGAACVTVPDIRWLRCDIKTVQLLPNVMAKQAAAEKGVFEAIMIRDGIVTEGSHTNVMAVIDGVIRTHPTNNLILPGVTRAVVLDLAASAGNPVVEEAFSHDELESADELFVTGTTSDVMPIVRVDDKPVGSGKPGPVTVRLVKEIRAYLDAAVGAAHATP
jgi:D-alanine transaminase